MSDARPPDLVSPPWHPTTRITVGVLLLLLGAAFLAQITSLLPPVVMALLLAYLLHPLVTWLSARLHIRRGLAVLLLYVILLALLGAGATGLGLAVSQQVVALVTDLTAISRQIPEWLEQAASFRLEIGPWVLDLGEANLEPILTSVTSAVRPLLTETGRIVASVAGATASAVGVFVAVLVLGFYMLLDFGTVDRALIDLAPPAYRDDVRRLLSQSALVWNAFLRGQLLLALAVGGLVVVVLGALGVRQALVLGLIAGLLEFVPIFGPFIAGLVAVLVSLFQGANPWGLSPLGFAVVVLAAFMLIQQFENHVLVPRILGHVLKLHPLFVLLAALVGATLAGILGLLLAAPVLATLRLWLGYVYRKIVGLDTWPALPVEPTQPPQAPQLGRRLRRLWARLTARRWGGPETGE